VEVQGVGEMHCTSVTGLGVEVEMVEYREGGANANPRFIPTQRSHPPVTFNYALTQSDQMWDWLMSAANGEADRREVSIVMRDPTGTDEALRWNLTRALCTRWVASELDAMSKTLAIESMTLVYEGIERDVSGAPTESPPAGAPGR
jgi:phage tail-like protein